MPSIDINSNAPRQQFVASASQTVFNTNFIAFASGDVVVVVDGTTLSSGYTVTNLSNESGFTVTLDTGLTGGETVTIFRSTSISRDSQYQQDGRFDASPLERDLDVIITILQENRRDLDRAVVLDIDDTVSSISLPVAQADRLIKWNSAGNNFENGPSETEISNAQTNATDAAASAVASAASAASAASTLAQIQTVYDNFDDRYLGSKSSDPAVDNDGDALTDGALYFNTTSNLMRIYDLGGTTWNDVTTSIIDNSITNAKLADMANATIKGRNTAGSGDPEDLTMAQLRTLASLYTQAEVNALINALPQKFTSSSQSITAAGSRTIAHGLGEKPLECGYYIQCTSAEHGYSVGDVVFPHLFQSEAGSTQLGYGITIVPDTTNLNVRYGERIAVLDKSNGTFDFITVGNWDAYFWGRTD